MSCYFTLFLHETQCNIQLFLLKTQSFFNADFFLKLINTCGNNYNEIIILKKNVFTK